MADKTIQNTFNAFYSLRFGKNPQPIDWTLLGKLCEAEAVPDIMEVMKDLLDGFRTYLDKDNCFDASDWRRMADVGNTIFKKYIYEPKVFPLIAEIYDYIDQRETERRRA